VLRYDFLLGLSPTAKIATAHTAQDNLETVLMHLLRGSGLHGLTGIPPVRGRIIRPLLTVSAQEMGDYLVAHDLPHVEDSTNALDDCLRNRLRHHVVPLLEHENPSLSAAVARTTDTLRLEDQYLEDQAQAALTQALVGTQLSRTGLLAAPPALQYRMLQQFLSPVSSLTTAHLEAALALAQGAAPNARYALPGGHTLVRQYDLLALERLAAPTGPLAAQPLTADCTFGPWHITCRPGPAPATLPPGTLALALSALTGPLALRPRQPGDRISLPGGTKKLSRLLMDEKIPASLRDTLPVVSMGDTVLAILPLRVAKDFTPGAGRDSLLLSATRMEDEPCTRI
jgi:tRNA(Ile)-lysidine synthase